MCLKIEYKKIQEECGIFGGYAFCGHIAPYIKCALLKLQHRGQESAGICCGDEVQNLYKDFGLVNSVFKDYEISNLKGAFGIGHVRYSTFRDDRKENIQPLKIRYMGEDVSLAHNGNVSQAAQIREKFEKIGEVFLSASDSEVILKRIVFSLKKKPSEWTYDEVAKCLNDNFSLGSYCIVIYTKNRIMAFRDPWGYRPLMLAKTAQGYFVASEDVAFWGLDVEDIVEIQPGCGVEITLGGVEYKTFDTTKKHKKCVFEQIYFASAASNIFSKNVYQTRVRLGKLLAQCEDSDFCADVVVPVMDSGLGCAIGYAQKSGMPFHLGLVRNSWAERSFIQPEQKNRKNNVLQKFMPIKSVVEGKRVVLVDDSLVRGTTSSHIIKILKNAGAREVHMRSVSPKILNTCIWGVDIPTKEELICHGISDSEIAEKIGADSVKFLPLDMIKEVFEGDSWCLECFLEDRG